MNYRGNGKAGHVDMAGFQKYGGNELKEEEAPNKDKLFTIYKLHLAIIV